MKSPKLPNPSNIKIPYRPLNMKNYREVVIWDKINRRVSGTMIVRKTTEEFKNKN